MKFTLFGKILKRTQRTINCKDGETRTIYELEIEEPGKYPSVFVVQSTLASLFGQKDGPFGVGKWCTANGYANGRVREVPRRDGSGTFRSYSVYLTLRELVPSAAPATAAPETAATGDADGSDDLPY